jgi:hypothetical protein
VIRGSSPRRLRHHQFLPTQRRDRRWSPKWSKFAAQGLTNLRSAAVAIDGGDIAADVSTNSSSCCRAAANPLRWSRSPASSSWPGIASDRVFDRQSFVLRAWAMRVPGHGRCHDRSRIGPEDFFVSPVMLIRDTSRLMAHSNLRCRRSPPRCLDQSKVPVAPVVHRIFQAGRRTFRTAARCAPDTGVARSAPCLRRPDDEPKSAASLVGPIVFRKATAV